MADYNEGQRLKGSDGNVYVVRGGVPVLEQAARPIGGIVIKEADPTTPYKGPTAAEDLTGKTLSNREARKKIDNMDRGEIPSGYRMKSDGTLEKIPGGPGIKQDAADTARHAAFDALVGQINDTQAAFNNGPRKTSGFAGIRDYLGYPENKVFNTAGAGLADQVSSAFRVPGIGSQSDADAARAAASAQPFSGDFDATIEQKLKQTRNRVDVYRAANGLPPAHWTGLEPLSSGSDKQGGAIIGGIPGSGSAPPGGAAGSSGGPSSGGVGAGPTGGVNKTTSFYADPGSADTSRTALSNNGLESVPDPISAGAGKRLNDMLVSGASDDEIRRYAASTGLNLKVDAALDFRRKNPRYSGSYPLSGFGTKLAPIDPASRIINDLSQTPGGTFASNMGNAAVAGQIPNLIGLAGGNKEQARLGFDATSDTNRKSAFLGNIIGGTLGAAGLETGLGATALKLGLPLADAAGAATSAGRWVPRAADAIYGGASGEGSAEPGNELTGGLIGAIAGAGGGMAGRTATRAAGNAARGVTREAVQYLRGQDIPLTAGQALGGTAKQIEDQLTGYPLIGGIIKSRRDEGLTGFNRAMFRQGAEGAPVADIGERGAGQLDQVVRDAYAPLNGTSASVDPQLGQDLASAATTGRAIPGRAADFDHIVNTRVAPNFDTAGTMSGANLQDTLQQLRRASAGQGLGAMHADDFSGALGGVENALTGMFQRQAPEAMDAINHGNRIYTNQSIIDSAVKAARNTRGPDGDALVMPSQLNTASVMNTNRYGGASRAATTDRPFYDLATNGQEVLPSRIGDSGTAGRLALGGALTLAAGGGGYAGDTGGDVSLGRAAGVGEGSLTGIAGLGLLAALGGSRGGQRALVSMLADRPDLLRRIGTQIYDNPGLGGALLVPGGVAVGQALAP